MQQFILGTRLKKHKHMDGYRANAHCLYSFLKHVKIKFNISDYDMKRYLGKGKILVWNA